MSTPPTAASPRRAWIWPVSIATVLVTTMTFNIVLMMVARQDESFAIEPDYYAKAVAWDATMAQERRNAALGWSATSTLALAGPATTGRLSIVLRDRFGASVTSAVVHVEAIPNAHATERIALDLSETEAGRYVVPVASTRGGEWELRVMAERVTDRFTTHVRTMAEPVR
jgi:nitrogen fixation protein FixH